MRQKLWVALEVGWAQAPWPPHRRCTQRAGQTVPVGIVTGMWPPPPPPLRWWAWQAEQLGPPRAQFDLRQKLWVALEVGWAQAPWPAHFRCTQRAGQWPFDGYAMERC